MILMNGEEFLFSARTLDYLGNYFPRLEVKCDSAPGLKKKIIGSDASFTNPLADDAPWVQGGAVKHAGMFLGGLITGVVGMDDSTQVGNYTEMKDEGAVHHSPHFGAREIRITATLFARTDHALDFGIDWTKAAIDESFCGTGFGANCNGSEIGYLTGDVVGTAADYLTYLRSLMDVKVLSGVKVLGYPQFKSGVHAAEIEFILMAGNPFSFNTYPIWTANLKDGTATTVVTEKNCDPEIDAYEDLVTDPLDGQVARPPRPPAINPLDMPSFWTRRYTNLIPDAVSDMWGQMVFKISLKSTATKRQMRVRVYPESASAGSCGYSGEFYITYLPANHTLTIDGRTREIYLVKDGTTKRIPAANLVLGSAGRPLDWPIVDCRTPHRIEMDSMGSDDSVTTSTINAYLRR